MSDARSSNDLDTLLMQLVHGDLSEEDSKRLRRAIGRDSEHLDYCRDFLLVSAGLERLIYEDDREAGHWLKDTLKQELEKPVAVRTRIPWKRLVTSLAAMVLVGLAVTYVVVNRGGRAPSPLGEIINGLALQWSDPRLSGAKGVSLGREQRYLLQGVAEIRLASGARVIVRGPSRFALENENQLFLTSGTLTVKVPGEARGFTLHALQGAVVDYGTEFGVLVQEDGSLEAHVFAGRVQVTPSLGRAALTLDAGSSVLLTGRDEPVVGDIDPQRFTRRMVSDRGGACPGKRLNLADVVGGGDGYGTGSLGLGIDPASGQRLSQATGTRQHTRQGHFVELPEQRYIDGVFVPGGNAAAGQPPLPITSTGLVFGQAPETDGSYYDGIFNGAHFRREGRSLPAKLDGQTYGTDEYPALSLHPNAGISFDLYAIQRDNPGVSFSAFRALCGISESAGDAKRGTTDFWVLVDGEVRYHHQCLPGEFSTGLINVRLDASARFLTLITTCDGDPDGCWGFFGTPTLEFSPQQVP